MIALKTVIRLFWVPRFRHLRKKITDFQRRPDALLPDPIEFAITRNKKW